MSRISVIAVLAVLSLSQCAAGAAAQESVFEYNGLIYCKTADYEGLEVLRLADAGIADPVVIPDEVVYGGEALPVVSIGTRAFVDTDVTDVTLGANIRSIGSQAFSGTGLGIIAIPAGVSAIGDYAFAGCVGLRDIVISGQPHIGIYAFWDCPEISKIIIASAEPPICGNVVFDPDDIADAYLSVPAGTIPAYAKTEVWREFTDIRDVDGMASCGDFICRLDTRKGMDGNVVIVGALRPDEIAGTLVIPGETDYCGEMSPISMIWTDAFKGNERIESIIISPGDKELYLCPSCFADIPFTSLEIDRNFSWQNGSETQAPFGFAGTPPLARLVLGERVTYLCKGSFEYCGNHFNEVVLSPNITSIEYASFWRFRNWNITELRLPEKLGLIGSMAFRECSGIKSVVIPESIKLIGASSFESCSSLESIEFEGSLEGVTVYREAFSWNRRLRQVTVKDVVPPVGIPEDMFKFSVSEATLVVPVGSVNAYRDATVWKDFKNIVDTEGNDHDIANLYVQYPTGTFTLHDVTEPVTLHIAAKPGWRIHSVKLDDEDKTSELGADGGITIPAPQKHTCLSIVHMSDVSASPSLPTEMTDITARDGVVRISGTPQDAEIRIFDIDGSLVYQGTATEIYLNRSGVFTLTVCGLTFKFAM